MIIAIVTMFTFLSTFFAMLHFICSFCYRKEPVRTPRKTLCFSLIIPCFNEAPILKNTLNGVLRLDYEDYEIIFINDGSTDNTMPVFFNLLGLEPIQDQAILCAGLRGIYCSSKHPNIFVIDKSNSGKAASLNAGIALSHRELIVTLDGDSILEKNALCVMNCAFQDDDVIASGGAVHVMQYFLMDKCKSPLIALQALDYIKGFYIYKPSLCVNNALNIISGAFGVFRKTALIEVGKFRDGLGEDIDITIRLQEYAQKHQKVITYTMDAICYTECPQTWKDLRRQRIRWQKAFWDAVVYNRKFLLKYFFQASICFFMIADAAFSGTMAVMTFLTNYLLLSIRIFYGLPPLFLIFSGLAVLFNIANSLVAIFRAVRRGPYSFRTADSAVDGRKKTRTNPLYLGVFMDLIVFSFLRIGFFINGTVSYLKKRTSWDKLTRTNNAYTL